MRGLLTHSALLAWVMFQVPLVLCQSEGGPSLTPLFLMGQHDCPGEESDADHRHRCHEADDCENRDDGSDSNDESGRHVLITVASPTPPPAVGLPMPACSVAPLLPPTGVLEAAEVPSLALVWRDLGPPPGRDPISAADCLLV